MIQCRKDSFGFISKLTLVIFAGSILLLPIAAYAQTGGEVPGDCGVAGADPTQPYNPCPIDSWVWVLVIIAAIAGSFYINNSKKLQRQA